MDTLDDLDAVDDLDALDDQNTLYDLNYLDDLDDLGDVCGDLSTVCKILRPRTAGHESWKRKFPEMIRVLHRLDLARNTRVMEERLDGSGPWYLVKQGKESKQAGYITGATGTRRLS